MAECKTYYQSGEPTDMTPGTTWIDDAGNRNVRGTNTAWRYAGNVNLDNMGSVNRAGDTMDGALEGAHGLASLYSAPLTGTPHVNYNEIADKPWVLTLLEACKTTLRDEISDATRKTSSSMAIGENIAFGYDVVDHGNTIPLPSYSNGVMASKDEIVLLHVGMRTTLAGGDNGNAWTLFSVDPVTLIVTANMCPGPGYAHFYSVNYVIVCMKK